MSKKSFLKRTLAIALAAMLTIGAGPLAGLCGIELPSISSFTASAAENEPVWTVATEDMLEIKGSTIEKVKEGVTLTGNIEIPSHINGTAITAIASNVFAGCLGLTAVKIPRTISQIGLSAFQSCSNLETVYFNSDSCSLSDGGGLDYAAFSRNDKLTTFVFGEGVSSIPNNVCYNVKNLQNVYFKDTVTKIGAGAFRNCSSLKSVDLSDVMFIGDGAFSGCISIPSFELSENLETIGMDAFVGCQMTEITIPSKVSKIGLSAFQACLDLETVYFNSNSCILSDGGGLDYAAFSRNDKLTTFVFGEGVSSIPNNVCYNVKNLQNVVFKDTVTKIGAGAFRNCSSLKSVDLSDVMSIGDGAFAGCISIPSFELSENLETIGMDAFVGCKMTEITIPSKVSKIGLSAFQACSDLETVYFNSNSCILSDGGGLDYAAFSRNDKLTTFVFGEDVTSISNNVCYNAKNLRTVIFKGLVTKIGSAAFYNCTSLSDVYYNAGSEEDWNKVTIKSGNDILSSADVTIHFGIKPEHKTNKEFDVTASYISNAFTEEVDIAVTEANGTHENGTVNILDNEIREMVGCFNIKMVSVETGKAVQPVDGKTVTITMPIPEQYHGKKNFKITHELENGARENFATNASNRKNKIEISADGKYLVFEVSSFSKFEVMTFEAAPAISIKNNTGSKTISYGETLRLTANSSNMPADAKIFWYVDGVKMGEGTTFEVSPESGSVEVTVKVVDANGNDYADTDISDIEKVTVKSGFFQKLISFFKNLFRISRVVTQAFMVK